MFNFKTERERESMMRTGNTLGAVRSGSTSLVFRQFSCHILAFALLCTQILSSEYCGGGRSKHVLVYN